MQHINRRSFLKTFGIAGTVTLTGIPSFLFQNGGQNTLTILHTNDVHSRLDPFPNNDPNYPGMGGFARRAALIKELRKLNPNLLLLDAGDILQGTPYFNMYGGKPEFKLMSRMGYDAAAFGNHEFDNGMDGFADILPYADFPFLAANYDFSQTILAGEVEDHLVLQKGNYKIGIYGLGIDPEGLVSRNLYKDTKYHDAIEVANEQEQILHDKHRCDIIIGLSHLGLAYGDDQVSDTKVAGHTKHTDIIIGGHTHNLLDPARKVTNRDGNTVYIGQAGYGGAYMGIMEVVFDTMGEIDFVELYTTKI